MFRLAAVGRVSLLLLSVCIFHSQVQLYKLGVLKPSQFYPSIALMALATVLGVVVPLVLLFRKLTLRNLIRAAWIDLANTLLVFILMGILAATDDNCQSRYCHRINTLTGFLMAYMGHTLLLSIFNMCRIPTKGKVIRQS